MADCATSHKQVSSTSEKELPLKKSSRSYWYTFKWTTTATAVSAATLAVFAIDFVVEDAGGGMSLSGTILNLGSLIHESKLLTLDCLMGGSILALILFKIICSSSKGNANIKPKQSSDQKVRRPRGPRPQEGKGNAGGSRSAKDGTADGRWVREEGESTVEQAVSNSKWNHAIDLAARVGDASKASSILIEFERRAESGVTSGFRPDAVSYNLVIRAYAKKGDFNSAIEWLSRMESSGVEATVCSYNTVLDACAKADRADVCEAWLKTMLRKGLDANVISYATAIYAWARHGDESRSKEWLEKMIAAGIKPDAVCYNSMIHACGVSGNAAGAEHWMEEMQACGLEASVTTYTAVIDACAKAGDVKRAETWLEKMMSAGVEPNVVSFSAMIDACAKASDPKRAEHWHDRMVERGITPNAHSYSAVINACAKVGDHPMAEEWLGKAEKVGSNDVVLYSSVIDACGKAGDADRAMEIFNRMQSQGIRPHIVAYAALARPFAYKGDWKTVEGIADDLQKNGIRPNEYFLYAQLLSYATCRPREAERAETCFRQAVRLGLKANDHVVTALVRAVGRDRCVELMDELCQGRSVPNTAIRGQNGTNHRSSNPKSAHRPDIRR